MKNRFEAVIKEVGKLTNPPSVGREKAKKTPVLQKNNVTNKK
ncbi:MAG: hypothetical protein ACI8Z5_000590 [Lentimonas sp.]|jgi:hypothetical protein